MLVNFQDFYFNCLSILSPVKLMLLVIPNPVNSCNFETTERIKS